MTITQVVSLQPTIPEQNSAAVDSLRRSLVGGKSRARTRATIQPPERPWRLDSKGGADREDSRDRDRHLEDGVVLATTVITPTCWEGAQTVGGQR